LNSSTSHSGSVTATTPAAMANVAACQCTPPYMASMSSAASATPATTATASTIANPIKIRPAAGSPALHHLCSASMSRWNTGGVDEAGQLHRPLERDEVSGSWHDFE
jgi:hypothetical protein